MAKEKVKITLLEKAKKHKVKRQEKNPATPEELEVYVAWFKGDLSSSQACYALDISAATFRGNSGATLRAAIISGDYELDEA
jgi:hypothetical protein